MGAVGADEPEADEEVGTVATRSSSKGEGSTSGSSAQRALSPDVPRVAWLRTQLQRMEERRGERLVKVAQLTLIAIIFITFVLQNAQPVNVHFLLFSVNIRLIWVIFGCGLLGSAAGYLIGRPEKSLRALFPEKAKKPARSRTAQP
jgi:uncharacterized integral membrane protein